MPRKLPMVVEGDKDPEIDYEAVRAEEEALKASRQASAILPAPINVSTLETIAGDLRAYAQLQSSTMLHVDELMHERRTNPELCNQAFYTADGELYFLQGKKKTPTLAITREKDNLVLRHLDDAFMQLTTARNYRPDVQEAQQSIGAPETVLIDLTKLRLQGDDAALRYLRISTTQYDKLQPEEQKLAERVYGQGDEFGPSMALLKEAGISETRIYVLNPSYVREEAEQGPLGRASWLSNFTNYSNFYADDRSVVGSLRLRGVRRESVGEMPAGRAP